MPVWDLVVHRTLGQYSSRVVVQFVIAQNADKNPAAAAFGRLGGLKAGKARAKDEVIALLDLTHAPASRNAADD